LYICNAKVTKRVEGELQRNRGEENRKRERKRGRKRK
jgi:hypothetical protein